MTTFVFDPPPASSTTKLSPKHELKYSIPDAVKMVTEILESGTYYSDILLHNIKSFHLAMHSEDKLAEVKQWNKNIENRLLKIEANLLESQDKSSTIKGLPEPSSKKLCWAYNRLHQQQP